MKYVLNYSSGDGCTFSCDENLPFESDKTKEDLELELLEKWEEYIKSKDFYRSEVKFYGLSLDLSCFTFDEYDKLHKRNNPQYSEPSILTLEDWFENNKPISL